MNANFTRKITNFLNKFSFTNNQLVEYINFLVNSSNSREYLVDKLKIFFYNDTEPVVNWLLFIKNMHNNSCNALTDKTESMIKNEEKINDTEIKVLKHGNVIVKKLKKTQFKSDKKVNPNWKDERKIYSRSPELSINNINNKVSYKNKVKKFDRIECNVGLNSSRKSVFVRLRNKELY